MDDKQQLRDLRAAVEAVIEDDHEGEEMLAILVVDRVIAPLVADRDRARDIAVALEQENARLTERIAAASKRARTRDEDLLHMRDNSKNAQRTMSRGHAWEVAAYEVRTIADLLDGGEAQ
jgi:hypothetical protein